PLEHGRAEQTLFRLANILSFGRYVHREKENPEMEVRLDVARRLAYHTRFLQEVARSTPQIDVAWDLDEIRRSLNFITAHGSYAGSKSAAAAANIFTRTKDAETRRSCLETLSRINNPKAKSELLRLSQLKDLDPAGRDLVVSYLKNPVRPNEALTVSSEKSSSTRVDQ
ncbi:MAG TPA: hypothetical protein VK208_20775, partial [Pyrinomonadaceae bacterium]|nr:hypothetical protein [Pyrinomonadaceae bacterium]